MTDESELICKECGHKFHLHKGWGKECYVTTEQDEGGEDLYCECKGFRV